MTLCLANISIYFWFLFFRPINHLFVDDWEILENLSTENFGFNRTNTIPYNGTSLFVARALYLFTTNILNAGIATTSLILFLLYLVVLGYFAARITRGLSHRNFAIASIFVIGMNLNQYQNFTMPICWIWILSTILFMFSYLLFINSAKRINRLTLILILFVAPYVFIMGFIIPLTIFIASVFSIVIKGFRKHSAIFLVAALLSFALNYLVSIKASEVTYGRLDGLESISKNPLNAAIFIIASFGSPFTPASQFALPISIIFGLLVALLLYTTVKKLPLLQSLTNGDILIYGLLFHGLQLLGRFDGSVSSIINVSSPRYTSGSMILLVGIFLKFMNNPQSKQYIYIYVSVVLVAVMSISGLKTAWDYSSVRSLASKKIENCISRFGIDDPICLAKLDPGREILSQEAFEKAIETISSLRKTER